MLCKDCETQNVPPRCMEPSSLSSFGLPASSFLFSLYFGLALMTEVDRNADLEELALLKSLATRPWVVQVLEELIAERKVDTSSIVREPIGKTKVRFYMHKIMQTM